MSHARVLVRIEPSQGWAQEKGVGSGEGAVSLVGHTL